jgi:hypothetical protein
MLAPRPESAPVKLGELPSASSQDKVEVWSRTTDDGSPLLELIEYKWGSGLGWYVHKRVTLDSAQVQALQALLGDTSLFTAEPAPRPRPQVVREDNVIRLLFSA